MKVNIVILVLSSALDGTTIYSRSSQSNRYTSNLHHKVAGKRICSKKVVFRWLATKLNPTYIQIGSQGMKLIFNIRIVTFLLSDLWSLKTNIGIKRVNLPSKISKNMFAMKGNFHIMWEKKGKFGKMCVFPFKVMLANKAQKR